ncbi:hypothetical protein [Clostridium sp. VAP52]|uniref:hypothetical protein n=1 Tax=Clostridium sp. VAP52 TaxID=2949977 RepID=UPI00207945D9|nr:hypothetical protein [Clostridium sp. VAP52]
MPRCNYRRCGFFYVCPCFNKSSDCYCATRMTPKQCEKKIKELEITDIKELWKFINNLNK